ncbi:radiation-inducible immediate-early gene IEX-1 [Betta splendens]|uniref:Radiation-inducible immediate-early gene IEX-1 n=1 Tax=Betta splendens TaxID=158456 RepID=A0A8M1HIY3_BETSP|nr:radiation-inducible immediate-early gene IEX-1 [Betta splendens]
MYARTNSVTLVRHERFAFSGTAARSTQPEVFTFEHVPPHATAVSSYVPIRPKRRCTRVMYPAKVRMHLPPPERSRAKRWLLLLSLVLLWQICTEDPCADAQLSGADDGFKGFSFPSAEDEAGPRAALSAGSGLPAASPAHGGDGRSSSERLVRNSTRSEPRRDAESGRSFEQSASNGYVVALLVYHRLGSDN